MGITVFGLKELSSKIPELLRKSVENKDNPDRWSWVPSKPEKIKNLRTEVLSERDAVAYAALSNYTRGEVRQNVIFLFAMGNLSYGFISKFEEANIKYVFIDYVQFILSGKLTINLEENIQKAILTIGDIEVDLNDISTVLWNTPKFPFPLFDFNIIPPKNGRHIYLHKKRWSQFLKDLKFYLRKDVIWLPGDPFSGSQDWQNKNGEYKMMLEIGIKIPPTIFTNQAEDVLAFSQRHNNKLLLREFAASPFSFPPIPIKVEDISLKDLKASPCCFQAYVEKKYEIRAVLLFDKIFPCKIHSQDSDMAKADWRVHDDANVKWELIQLPPELVNNLKKLRDALGLTWCSVDIIYSTDDCYYVLEMNRPGGSLLVRLVCGARHN